MSRDHPITVSPKPASQGTKHWLMIIGENLFLLNEKPTYRKICIKKEKHTQKNTNFFVKFIIQKFN